MMELPGIDAQLASSFTAFDVARAGVAKLVGVAAARIAWENAKVTPDGTAVAQWRDRQTAWAAIGSSLRPDDVAGVRAALADVAEAIGLVSQE